MAAVSFVCGIFMQPEMHSLVEFSIVWQEKKENELTENAYVAHEKT
jgi:hypothetical protein